MGVEAKLYDKPGDSYSHETNGEPKPTEFGRRRLLKDAGKWGLFALGLASIDSVVAPSAYAQPEAVKFDALYGEQRQFANAKQQLGYLIHNFYQNPTREVADETLAKIKPLIASHPEVREFSERTKIKDEDKLYNQALQQMNQRNNKKALELYEDMIEKGSTDSSVYHQIGICYFRLKKKKEAIKALREATSIEPGSHNNRWTLGNVLFINEQYTEAYFEMKVALMLNPKDHRRSKMEEIIEKCEGNMPTD